MLSTHRLPCSDSRLVRFGARIIVRDFESNFPRILAAACQRLPYVVLASSSNDDALEIDPGLSDEIRFLVVSEDGDLELVVVGRIMHCKSQLLVPFGSLSASDIRRRLLGLFAESRGAVGILLAYGLAVGQVLCAVDNGDERANDRSVNTHVGEESCRVRAIHGKLFGCGRHDYSRLKQARKSAASSASWVQVGDLIHVICLHRLKGRYA